MDRLFVGLLGSAFAFGSVAAMADDKTPAQPVDPAKLKAEKDAAKAAAAKMTPQEKAAARKAKRAKKQQEASAIAKEADTGNKMGQQQKDEADTGAAKAQPKALPEARPRIGVPLDRRYSEPLPPGGPAQRDPAKSNP
jgi:hypothetical protein